MLSVNFYLTELDERIGPGGCVYFVTELRLELLREVFKERIGQLLVEVTITKGQEACVLLNDVTKNN